jgi:hypothetical protein
MSFPPRYHKSSPLQGLLCRSEAVSWVLGSLREAILQTKIFPEPMNFPAWRVAWKACGLSSVGHGGTELMPVDVIHRRSGLPGWPIGFRPDSS